MADWVFYPGPGSVRNFGVRYGDVGCYDRAKGHEWSVERFRFGLCAGIFDGEYYDWLGSAYSVIGPKEERNHLPQ